MHPALLIAVLLLASCAVATLLAGLVPVSSVFVLLLALQAALLALMARLMAAQARALDALEHRARELRRYDGRRR